MKSKCCNAPIEPVDIYEDLPWSFECHECGKPYEEIEVIAGFDFTKEDIAAAKREGAIEVLEELIALATTKSEYDGVEMTWATSSENEIIDFVENKLSSLKDHDQT